MNFAIRPLRGVFRLPPRLLRYVYRLAAPVFLFLYLTAPAFAQAEEASPADTTIGWVFRWLNFALVFGGLAYILVKYAAPAFRKRADGIANAIAEGARAREEAERRKREAEARLAGLEQEIAQMREVARGDAEAEAKRIRELASDEARKIDQAALAEIAAAERAARVELKKAAARLAVERATALLRQQITPRAESALFRGFLQGLERSAN